MQPARSYYHRCIGSPVLKGYGEKGVPAAGREFSRRLQSAGAHEASSVSIAEWNVVMEGILESPKQANQSTRRLLQMSPIVPDISLYSGAPRTTGNPWTPGRLIANIITIGSDTRQAAEELWHELAEALDVMPQDDVWARWLHEEFQRRSKGPAWKDTPLHGDVDLGVRDKRRLQYPAKRLCKDLKAILQSKSLMTRRQWVSLLESVLRIGSVSHILWLSDVNGRLWVRMKEILRGASAPSLGCVTDDVISHNTHFLSYGYPAMSEVRGYISRYLVARIGINGVLWKLEELKVTGVRRLADCESIENLLRIIEEKRDVLAASDVLADMQKLQDEHAKLIAGKKGIGANLFEFCRYVLGQRQTADETLRGYDQGYYLRKKGDYASAQLIVSFGPVAVLAMVQCCLQNAAGPRSIQALCRHMLEYGIKLQGDDVINGELGRKLRTLGLVLDSPDAESGMLLMRPFN